MYLLVKCARSIVKAMQKIRSLIRRGLPKALLGSTKAGQCHRYSGYEIAPSHCEIRLLLKSLKKRGQLDIEPINATVAATGSRALIPGNAVLSLKVKDAIAIPIAPNHGMNLFFQNESGINRSRAPNPSSHALVGRE